MAAARISRPAEIPASSAWQSASAFSTLAPDTGIVQSTDFLGVMVKACTPNSATPCPDMTTTTSAPSGSSTFRSPSTTAPTETGPRATAMAARFLPATKASVIAVSSCASATRMATHVARREGVAAARPNSRKTSASSASDSPVPPAFSGTLMPKHPSSARSPQAAWSHSVAPFRKRPTSSRSARKPRTVSTI